MLRVNLVGSFLIAREAARRVADGGSITLISSQAGLKGAALWSAYSASKAGVNRLAESLAQELGPRGIRVNCVCPGTVDTAMIDGRDRPLGAAHGTAGGGDPRPLSGGHPAGAAGPARGGGRGVRLPRLRPGQLCQRHGAGRRRRRAFGMSAEGPGAATQIAICVPDNIGRLIGKRLPAGRWDEICRAGMPMPDYFLVTGVDNRPHGDLAVTGYHTGFKNGFLRPLRGDAVHRADRARHRFLPGRRRAHRRHAL